MLKRVSHIEVWSGFAPCCRGPRTGRCRAVWSHINQSGAPRLHHGQALPWISEGRFIRGAWCVNLQSSRIDNTTIYELINAAIQAPSAVNQQAWSFTVVRDKALLARISREAKVHPEDITRRADVPTFPTTLERSGFQHPRSQARSQSRMNFAEANQLGVSNKS